MNLSPLKYANILSSKRGPIDRIETGRVTLSGNNSYLANAWLSDHLHLRTIPAKIFSNAAGSGTDESAMVAEHKAISEALERWAYHYLMQIEHKHRYGFDIDESTTGMAAYPGLFRGQARRRARMEAVERYCIASWWLGYLDAVAVDEEAYHLLKIENPISSLKVALAWTQFSVDRHAYGTAAGRTWQQATLRARTEMELSAMALKRHGTVDIDQLDNHSERQFLYYSLPEGHGEFLRRLESRPVARHPGPPRKVIDRIIPGPWQKYATVWRVLYQAESSGAVTRRPFLY